MLECLQSNLVNIATKEESAAQSRDSFWRLQYFKNQGVKTRARLNWISHGNKGARYFFQILKSKEARERIESIWNEGKELNSQDEILLAFGH